jgi:hypothetical protein
MGEEIEGKSAPKYSVQNMRCGHALSRMTDVLLRQYIKIEIKENMLKDEMGGRAKGGLCALVYLTKEKKTLP